MKISRKVTVCFALLALVCMIAAQPANAYVLGYVSAGSYFVQNYGECTGLAASFNLWDVEMVIQSGYTNRYVAGLVVQFSNDETFEVGFCANAIEPFIYFDSGGDPYISEYEFAYDQTFSVVIMEDDWYDYYVYINEELVCTIYQPQHVSILESGSYLFTVLHSSFETGQYQDPAVWVHDAYSYSALYENWFAFNGGWLASELTGLNAGVENYGNGQFCVYAAS